MTATAVVIGRKRGLRGFWASLDSGQRRTVLMMAAVVSGLHLLGFGILYVLVVAEHDQLGSAGAFTLGRLAGSDGELRCARHGVECAQS